MSADDRPRFGAAEVIQLASKFEKDDPSFVIGGQATNLWAWYYDDADEIARLQGPFTSEDIDYFGTRDVARNLAEALNGVLEVPDADDHTPNTARVTVSINGKPLRIDFMAGVLGVKNRELENGVVAIAVAAAVDGHPVEAIIKVLHPVICLKSRILNMLHPAVRRTDQIAKRQLDAAAAIVRCYISDALDDSDRKEARRCFATLFRYLRSAEYVKDADIRLGIDLLDIIKAFAQDERIDARYREHQLQKMIASIERRRAGRRSRNAQ
jgi:hypothetical protein